MKKVGLVLVTCLLLLLAAGCAKNNGWKTQSAPAATTLSSSGQKIEKQTSVTVSSILHDLFGGELPADTDRYGMPEVEETTHVEFDATPRDGAVYGTKMYYCFSNLNSVYCRDLETGEDSVFTDETGRPTLLCTDSDGVYVYDMNEKAVLYYSFDGERGGSVALPISIHAGVDYADWAYICSLEHYDGTLLLAARDCIWSLKDGDTVWKRADITLMANEIFRDATLLSRDRMAYCVGQDKGKQLPVHLVMESNLDGSGALLLSDDNLWQHISCNQGRLYGTDMYDTSLWEITREGSFFIQKLTDGGSTRTFEVSNGTVFVMWATKHYASLIPSADSARTVRVFAPVSDVDRLTAMTECAQSVPVSFHTAEDGAFFEQLNANLLAGSDDFDLALVTGEKDRVAAALHSVLLHNQFADLGDGAGFSENAADMFPGVRDMMNARNKTAFLPLGFDTVFYGLTEAGRNSVGEVPSADWSLEDFLALEGSIGSGGFGEAGKADGMIPSRTVQCTQILLSLAVGTVQANTDLLSVDVGKGVEAALSDLLHALGELRDSKKLLGNRPLVAMAGRDCFYAEPLPGMDGTEFVTLPATGKRDKKTTLITSGKQPLAVTAFLFVNPNSSRIPQAYAFLADLTNEENRYNTAVYSSPLWPDLNRYYRIETVMEDPITGEFSYSPHKVSVIDEEHRDYAERLNRFLADYYANSELCLVTVTDRAEETAAEFCSGSLTAADCAKILYEEFVYKLKG